MLHAIKLQPKLRGLVDFSQLRLGVTGFQLCVSIQPALLRGWFSVTDTLLFGSHWYSLNFTFGIAVRSSRSPLAV